MIDRLTGGANKPKVNPPIANSSSNRQIGKATTNNKPSMSAPKKDNAKDVLNKMKEVKAQYNARSKNSAVK